MQSFCHSVHNRVSYDNIDSLLNSNEIKFDFHYFIQLLDLCSTVHKFENRTESQNVTHLLNHQNIFRCLMVFDCKKNLCERISPTKKTLANWKTRKVELNTKDWTEIQLMRLNIWIFFLRNSIFFLSVGFNSSNLETFNIKKNVCFNMCFNLLDPGFVLPSFSTSFFLSLV